MTVNELIEELKKYPGHLDVLIFDGSCNLYFETLESIRNKKLACPRKDDSFNGQDVIEIEYYG